jgi:hypothetical protein
MFDFDALSKQFGQDDCLTFLAKVITSIGRSAATNTVLHLWHSILSALLIFSSPMQRGQCP